MWSDIVLGGLALVRYEGWPIAILYILWRRDLRATLAAWGMLSWLVIKAIGVDGYVLHPSTTQTGRDWTHALTGQS